LALPWVVVTGSLAYNDMAVVLFGAAAVAASRERGVKAAMRGVLVGALVGAACSAKPTALFLVGPAAGLAMLAAAPRRAWVTLAGTGAAAGLAMLLPWLVRNAVACGNPVFPALTGVLGSGWWNQEQVGRFAAAHRFDGGLGARLIVALWRDPAAAAGAPDVVAWRGVLNSQWGALFPLAAVASVVVAARGRGAGAGKRFAAAVIAGLGVTGLAWLMLTHVQARFLVPLVVTAVPLVAVAAALSRSARVAGVLGAGVVLGHAVWTAVLFGRERGGDPGALLIAGPGVFMGEPYDAALHDGMPVAVVNRVTRAAAEGGAASGVLLIGVSTPLYVRGQVLWATTWDTNPWVALMETHGGDSRRVAEALIARGVGYVLIDAAELARLERSGWRDPRLSEEAVMAWAQETCRPIAVWGGQTLLRVRE
jgi:hypothetical protein